MYRTLLRTILTTISLCAFFSFDLGQIKPVVEIDVTKCWSHQTGDLITKTLATDGIRVYSGSSGAKVEALQFDGKKVWSSELGGDISSNILAVDGGLFLVTSTISNTPAAAGGSILRSLSKETGVTNWALKLSEANKYFLADFNGFVIVVSDNGKIASIDAKTGAIKWKREIAEGFVAEPVFAGDFVTVAATGNQIFNVSMATGEIDSMRKLTFAVTALGRLLNGAVVAGDDRGSVSMIPSGTDKAYWKFKSGGEISAILPFDGNILTASHDNFVYFLTQRGGLEWKRRLAGRIAQIAPVLDKFILLSSFEEHGAALIDISTGKLAGQIALGSEESLSAKPISSNGLIFVATDEAIYAYSLNGCPQSK